MSIKTFAQFGITLVILFFIFQLATNDNITSQIQNAAIDQQMMATTGVTASEALGQKTEDNDDAYNQAAGEVDIKKLEAMAKIEAEKMIQSGDVSAYREEVEKNPLLKKIIGN